MTLFEKALINDYKAFTNNEYDINMIDEAGKTLLHYAILGSAHDVVEILLNKKANINIKDNDGETPIFDCARKAKIELAKKLIINYANLNHPNNKGEYLLHLASAKGNKTFVRLLVENDIQTHVTANNGQSPVHYAILSGHIDIIKYLLKICNQSFKLVDKNNNTLLHYATRTSNDLLIYYLVGEGINANYLNNRYETALFNAVRYSTKETIKALLSYDSYIDIVNINGESPLDLASVYQKYNIQTLLFNYKMLPKYERLVNKQALAIATLNRNIKKVESLIFSDLTMRRDRYNYTALDYAKLYKFNKIVDLLKTIPVV